MNDATLNDTAFIEFVEFMAEVEEYPPVGREHLVEALRLCRAGRVLVSDRAKDEVSPAQVVYFLACKLEKDAFEKN